MDFESLRRVMAQLGVNPLPQPNSSGWLHISCLFAQWKHRSGTDRSRGMALKVEDKGISAYVCKACQMEGRISGLARALSVYRGRDYDAVAMDADRFDMLGSELAPFDEAFSVVEELPTPLDEALYAGMFEPIGNYPEAVAFMQSRNVGKATCDKLKLEFDPEKRRIVFPIRNGRNELFGWSGRTVIPGHEPKVLDYAGLPKIALILGEERWRPGYRKLVVEGLIAYARMHEIGAEDYMDIGALLGSKLTKQKAEILLAHGCATLAMPDPDQAGAMCLYGKWNDEKQAHEGDGLIDMLAGEIPVMVPYYPQGVADIDDITLPDLLRVCDNAPAAFPAPKVFDKKSRGY